MIFHQCPPGMKQQVLTFYTKLLAHIRQPLLPHINVHRPVQVRNYTVWCSVYFDRPFPQNGLLTGRLCNFFATFLCQKLIRLCGEVLAAPTENEEIQFLCIVCAKLKQDPYLVNFFLEVSCYDTRERKKLRSTFININLYILLTKVRVLQDFKALSLENTSYV